MNSQFRALYLTSIIFFFILLSTISYLYAQEPIKVNNGKHTLYFGGTFSMYYNYRQYGSGVIAKYDKNTFKPKDARFDVQGKYGDDYEYHIQVDFASIGQGTIDPAAPPIYDANFTYKGLRKIANIEIGYDKVPYSLSSLIEHEWSPFWERPTIVKGDMSSRRDLGIKFERSFWDKRINALAGIYTGVGEVALGGVNDASGNPEYIGRVEFCYPSYRKREFVDLQVSKKPFFALGLNARYTNRSLPQGATFLPGEVGALLNDTALNYKVVDGKKSVIGADFSFAYKGFSAQVEGHYIKCILQNPNNPILMGLPKNVTNSKMNAGGWYTQLNYYAKPIKTIFSVRYDEVNVSDLVNGNSKTLGLSLAYQLNGFHSMLRAQMYRNLLQSEAINTNSWENQYRIGWQFVIQ